MPAYFVDAWYFIALLERRDAHHRNAIRLADFVANAQLVTHEAVLTEVLTYFADEGERGRALAVQAVRDALADIVVLSIDRALFMNGLNLYDRRRDKKYSLVDCMSMIVMKDRGITHVLTNDHHFRQEGFTVLSDAQ
jgi:predicted nucleic acid-binding protein